MNIILIVLVIAVVMTIRRYRKQLGVFTKYITSLFVMRVFVPKQFIFTTVKETFAKIVMQNDKFSKVIFSYGNRFMVVPGQDDEYMIPVWAETSKNDVLQYEQVWIKVRVGEEYDTFIPLEKEYRIPSKTQSGVSDKDRDYETREEFVPLRLRLKHWDVFEENPTTFVPQTQSQDLWGGIRLIGWPGTTKLYEYNFRWTSIEYGPDRKQRTVATFKPRSRTEKDPEGPTQDVLLAMDVYELSIIRVETSDPVSINIDMALTIQIVNPHSALFEVHRWNELVNTQVSGRVVKYVNSKQFNDLIEEGGSAAFKLMDDLKGLVARLRERIGIEIKKINIISLELADAEAQKASQKRYLARQYALAREIESKADQTYADEAMRSQEQVAPGYNVAKQLANIKVLSLGAKGGGILPMIDVKTITENEKTKSEERTEE